MNPLNYLSNVASLVSRILNEIYDIKNTLSRIQEALGRIEIRQQNNIESYNINDNEFKVFSQWGEDGLIQYLIKKVNINNKIFVEFGVENYTESNTRFLLVNNNWSGLIIDGSEDNIKYVKQDPIYWRYNLKAVCEFVRVDNINNILSDNGIAGEIGILSIDIDGNDYWIWKCINIINPAIVVIEYNHRFGYKKAVTIPYDPSFVRSKAHYSMIYYGASLKAICILADKKGYTFVGCNTAGNNAFFVRKDLKPDCVKELTPEEGFVSGQFREFRDENGQLLYLTAKEEQRIINSLPLEEIKE
ncbi:MAG: hypothetical protein IT392_13465 [Nitrospirae bacterium]|nr:hypothetical protein [Nitrospirota bacterium]